MQTLFFQIVRRVRKTLVSTKASHCTLGQACSNSYVRRKESQIARSLLLGVMAGSLFVRSVLRQSLLWRCYVVFLFDILCRANFGPETGTPQKAYPNMS